jgi:hypothetical protein
LRIAGRLWIDRMNLIPLNFSVYAYGPALFVPSLILLRRPRRPLNGGIPPSIEQSYPSILPSGVATPVRVSIVRLRFESPLTASLPNCKAVVEPNALILSNIYSNVGMDVSGKQAHDRGSSIRRRGEETALLQLASGENAPTTSLVPWREIIHQVESSESVTISFDARGTRFDGGEECYAYRLGGTLFGLVKGRF